MPCPSPPQASILLQPRPPPQASIPLQPGPPPPRRPFHYSPGLRTCPPLLVNLDDVTYPSHKHAHTNTLPPPHPRRPFFYSPGLPPMRDNLMRASYTEPESEEEEPGAPPPLQPAWTLERSIFAPRKGECEAAGFYDTERGGPGGWRARGRGR